MMDIFYSSIQCCFVLLSLVNICFFSEISCEILQKDLITIRSCPGLKSPKKLWWAKELTPDLHVAGGLTDRQIKYASESGFKSIISLCIDTKHGDFGSEYLPTAFEAKQIAEKSGLRYEAVLDEDEEWASLDAVRKLTEAINSVPKPILLHCNRAYTVAFVTLMYLANLTRYDPNFTPQVNSDKFYRMAALMGNNYTMEPLKAVVSEITGEPIVQNPPQPNAEPEDWLDYWLAHPVYKNWYTAGQLRKGHLGELEFIGFKSVINMREGTTTNGKPSQEMVTLLNIKDGTPTYDSNNNPLRQTDATLKTLVLDPKRDPSYISTTSDVNFERRNYEEYGDEIGYNEDLEREHFKEVDVDYYHLPIDSSGTYSAELFGKYKDQLLEIGRQGPVLVHCASGKRVAYIAVLAAALQYEKDLQWALYRINELGFKVSKNYQTDVYDMYKAWLEPARGNKSEL